MCASVWAHLCVSVSSPSHDTHRQTCTQTRTHTTHKDTHSYTDTDTHTHTHTDTDTHTHSPQALLTTHPADEIGCSEALKHEDHSTAVGGGSGTDDSKHDRKEKEKKKGCE